ncbi:cation-transporting P-type ATPase [uncultured Cocleimonas sp.]|uniref:cation-transporting P-type ATPase n=1 Tax=uncultured Cocleimonas sp. TaxID=1051587 RepID=UPI00260A3B7E|nr:cation-transporting P-type ATPase [uncultured Cocleimonas sp.]
MFHQVTQAYNLSAFEWFLVIGFIVVLLIFVVFVWRKIQAKIQLSNDASGLDHPAKNWHSEKYETVLEYLDTTPTGLLKNEAELRLDQYGENKLPEPKTDSQIIRFMYQFHNVLIYVLLGAGLVTAILGHWIDASVIFAVVIINAAIGFVQEGKAEDALRAIRQMLSARAMVVRDGRQNTIQTDALVPGDIVLLQSGDKVPADLRLFRVKGLQIQEAALTGESVAVEKSTQTVSENSVIGDRINMAFSGTIVTHGKGSGIVVATGANTVLGNISTLVSDVTTITTPLLRQMAQFGRWLTLAILMIATLNFLIGIYWRNFALSEMFLASVSLAVAVIPEGLPAIMTITLAIGVQKMAKRNAIIRKLPAVETLGAVSVICSDKTGTLTRNEMMVRSIATPLCLFDFEGSGYDPHGEITVNNKTIELDNHPLFKECLRASMLCNDASLEQVNNDWVVHGDPMEGALIVAAMKAGLDSAVESKNNPRTDLIPFESEHRYMATLHHSHNDKAFIYLKGAPERVLEMCDQQRTINGDSAIDTEYWLAKIESMAARGQRVLAIAVKKVPTEHHSLSYNDVENGVTMLGLFGLIDPPRMEAIEAVKTCSDAGIRVKMITGDHGATALAIARQLKLVNTDEVLTGQALELMSEDELRQKVLSIDVFARVNPEHKLKLVRLLQEQGLIVAMTGDGVNDAPALKRADVGTAMGKNGTEAAKEASEMVLVDDNFASIIHAVEEGRTIYDNLKKAILFILPTNGGEALVILAAIIFGFHELPLTPVQILWVNMITAVTLALTLAFEPSEKGVMQRPPRDPKQPLLNRYLIWRIAFVSIILMLGTFGMFLWQLDQGMNIEYARTVAVNTLVLFEIFYLFNVRYITAPILNWHGLTGNRYVLIAVGLLILLQLGFTYLPPLQSLFGTTAIDLATWLSIILVTSSVLIMVEIEKLILRNFSSQKNRPKIKA